MESHSKSSNEAPAAALDLALGAYERARAEKQMYDAMLLADLTLAACRRLHAVLKDASKVVNLVFTPRSDYIKNGVVHTD